MSIKRKRNKNKKQKKYSNPFFRSRNKGFINFFNNLSFQKIVFIIIFLFIIILFFILFYSNIFKIKNIEVQGSKKTPETEVAEFVLNEIQYKKNIFPNNIILFLNKNDLAQSLKNNYSISFVEIKKKFPNKLIINFLEKEYALVWFENGSYYYADKNGFLISEVSILEVDLSKYPLILNKSKQKKVDKKIYLEYNKINYIIELFNKLKKIKDIPIEKFIVNDEINTVIAVVVNGPELLFNIKEPIDKQIIKLTTVKKEKLKDDFLEKEYIDLRINDNIYYK